jgi:MoaA/NifB/PqqE/SkfB family radical SAM enzyme
LSTHCNAACFFCRDADYKGQLINFDDLHRLDSAIRQARVIELTGWGEPFSYPRLNEVVDKCLSLNKSPHLLCFTTNGSLLSREWGEKLSGKIHRLCISINAASSGVYAQQMRYKNSRFTYDVIINNALAFIEELTEEDRSRLAFHMVCNTDNYHEMTATVRVAARLRVPSVTMGNFVCANEAHMDKILLHVKEDYNKKLKEAVNAGAKLGVAVHGRFFFTKETRVGAQDTCVAPFERAYIEIPGSVTPCCFMGAARMGNAYDEGFENVWFSDLMNKLRDSRFLPACQVCTLYNPFDDKITHMSAYLTTKFAEHETPLDTDLNTTRKLPERAPMGVSIPSGRA